MSFEKLTILLSTYNGSRFLRQQLDSLYAQTYPNITILVRDDASMDNTREVLSAEQAKGRIQQVESDCNLGVTASFFELLQVTAKTDTGYLAFCDQDDIWFPDKVERAVSALSLYSESPALYCSRLAIVDEELSELSLSTIPQKTGFGNALVENIAVGCTMVLNRAAIDILCQKRLPDEVYIHDWWCYLVISCFGRIIYDDEPSIQYRQHHNNAIGAASSFAGELQRKAKRFVNGRRWISEQVDTFNELFGDQLPPKQRELIELFIKGKSSLWHRVLLACSNKIWRQKFIDNVILRIVILFNRI